jgi:tetratricopeptide (TPR) repeat protein
MAGTTKAAGLETVLAAARAAGDRRGEAVALGDLGDLALLARHASVSVGHYRRAVEIAEETGDEGLCADLLGRLGIAWSRMGAFREATECLGRALAIAREIGDREITDRFSFEYLMANLRNLGEPRGSLVMGFAFHAVLSRPEEAREFLENALEEARRVGDREVELAVLVNQAAVCFEAACAHLRRASEMAGGGSGVENLEEGIGTLLAAWLAEGELLKGLERLCLSRCFPRPSGSGNASPTATSSGGEKPGSGAGGREHGR